MSLITKIKSNSKLKHSDVLSETELLNSNTRIVTPVPMINVAMSGKLTEGLRPGSLMIAGPSKHFKTMFALLIVSSYMKQYPESVMIFYDTEFGAAKKYFANFGIPAERVLHSPVENVEELKHDMMNQLKGIKRGEKVIFFIDSIGNLASSKEIEDAENNKQVADMTRAKALKSFGRMITGALAIRDLYMVSVNHTYKTLEMFSKDVVGGGTGMYYIANDIWIIGRQQDKEVATGPVTGYNFIIKIDKSRTVKEGSKFAVSVSFDKGIRKWSGMFDLALEHGSIKPSAKKGWYHLAGEETGFRRAAVEYKSEFWNSLLEKTDLGQWIQDKYMLSDDLIISDDNSYEPEDEEILIDEEI